jgi:hypothetical protein
MRTAPEGRTTASASYRSHVVVPQTPKAAVSAAGYEYFPSLINAQDNAEIHLAKVWFSGGRRDNASCRCTSAFVVDDRRAAFAAGNAGDLALLACVICRAANEKISPAYNRFRRTFCTSEPLATHTETLVKAKSFCRTNRYDVLVGR